MGCGDHRRQQARATSDPPHDIGPKTVRNGPREHVGAISNLPISMHPAHSPQTHTTKGLFKSYGFRAAVELGAVVRKHRRGQNNYAKTKTAPRTLRSCFDRKRRPTTKTRKGKRVKRMHEKAKNQQYIKGTHEESRRGKNPMDAQK